MFMQVRKLELYKKLGDVYYSLNMFPESYMAINFYTNLFEEIFGEKDELEFDFPTEGSRPSSTTMTNLNQVLSK